MATLISFEPAQPLRPVLRLRRLLVLLLPVQEVELELVPAAAVVRVEELVGQQFDRVPLTAEVAPAVADYRFAFCQILLCLEDRSVRYF